MFMLKGVQRVTYCVNDLPAASIWYAKVLEREPFSKTDNEVSFAMEGVLLTLVPVLPETSTGNGIIAYWEVKNVLHAYYTLVAAGAVLYEPFSVIGDMRLAKLLDPFGNILGITDKIETNVTSLDEQPSDTALRVAMHRALAVNDARLTTKGPDNLAQLFLTDEGRQILHNEDARQKILTNAFTGRVYGFIVARTFFMDEAFSHALDENIPQIVLLGAGYDTRALRFADKIRNTQIFELDIPSTQQRKTEILHKAGVALPAQLKFVPVNFNRELLQDVLLKAGFDRSRQTLFIWEGVLYYLPEASVRQTLSSIKNLAADGSHICLDYLTHSIPAVSSSEAFHFFLDTADFKLLLAEYDIKITEHLDREDMEKKYLQQLPDGGLRFFTLVNGVIGR